MKHAKRCESKDPRSGIDSLEVWADSSPVYAAAQQQHAATTEQLRSQLAACTETHRNLERETVVLTHLEAMMPHCDPTLSNSLWNFENTDAETTFCSEEEHHDVCTVRFKSTLRCHPRINEAEFRN